MRAYLAGVGSTAFGKHPHRSLQSLATEAAGRAISDAGLPKEHIAAVFVGNFVGGIMTGQELLGPIVAANLGLHEVEAVKVEAACASSAAAVRLAAMLVHSGWHDAVLVVGAERLTGTSREQVTASMTAAVDSDTEARSGLTFPGFWGLVLNRHMHQYGTTREQVAAVTRKNRMFGTANDLAQFRSAVSISDVAESPLVADPIRRLDCCPVTDGAAAVLVTNRELAEQSARPLVRIAGSALVGGPPRVCDYPDITVHHATVEAARRAYAQAGIDADDIDVAELHDCFSIAEIVDSEDLGFFVKGDGGPAVLDGESGKDGAVVINPSGGLLSKGHPTGATGCGQLYEVVHQLRGTHPNPVADATFGLTHNAGGTAAAVTVHVLERAG